MKDIMKIVKSLEQSGLLIKGIGETIKNKAKEQKSGFFFYVFLCILGSTLTARGVIRASEGTIRAGENF